MKTGQVGILNVGAGDTKLTFDPKNPIELIRARRIVKDMLRRGYALLVRLPDGTHTRALDFDEQTGEYIIADFDPEGGYMPTLKPGLAPQPTGASNAEIQTPPKEKGLDDGIKLPTPSVTPRRSRKTKRLAAETTGAVAVARTAGG